MFKKSFLMLVLMLFLVTSIGYAAPVKLIWWSPDPPDISKPYFEIAKAFEAKNPDIKVEVQLVPEEGYMDKLLTAYAGGTAPDIFFSFDLRTTGPSMCEELTPYIKGKDGINMNIFDLRYLKKWMYIGDRIYALPRDLGFTAVYYNKDIFDKSGVAYPKPGWTLDDFLKIAQKLSKPEIQQYGTTVFAPEVIRESFGVKIFDETFRKILISTSPYKENTAKLIKWQLDLITKYKVAPPPSVMQVIGGGGGGPLDLFKTGKIGMIDADYWGVAIFKEANMKFGVIDYPRAKGVKPIIEGWVGTWSICNKSKYKNEAWKLLKFIAGPEGAEIMGKAWAIPILPSVRKKLNWDKDPYNKVFADILAKGTPWDCWWSQVPEAGTVLQPYWDITNNLLSKSEDKEFTLEEIIPLVEKAGKEMQSKLDNAWKSLEKIEKK